MYTRIFSAEGDDQLKIVCRIPFTCYFLGRELWRYTPKVKGRGRMKKWSPFYLYRKEWGDNMYYFVRV